MCLSFTVFPLSTLQYVLQYDTVTQTYVNTPNSLELDPCRYRRA
jgi:hypothetical protein